MQISYSRNFKKMYKKQTKPIRLKFQERLKIFLQNPYHPLLKIHALNGELATCKSINITGDIRAVFEEIGKNHIEFLDIGSHSELYS